MKYLFILALVSLNVGGSVANASTAFEDAARKVEKQYFNKNSVSLECGIDVDACRIEARVFGKHISIVVDFKKEGLKPDFSQITLNTADGVNDDLMMSFSVECDDDGMKYYKSLNADSVFCIAVMRVKDGSPNWLGVEAVPTYESKYIRRSKP